MKNNNEKQMEINNNKQMKNNKKSNRKLKVRDQQQKTDKNYIKVK